jgi:hypothetical protein
MPLLHITPADKQTALCTIAKMLQETFNIETASEFDGDICCVYRNKGEWVRFRITPDCLAPRGFTWYVWGPKPKTLDLEAQTAIVSKDHMGFQCIEKDAHVLRIARKYFFECVYESSDDE